MVYPISPALYNTGQRSVEHRNRCHSDALVYGFIQRSSAPLSRLEVGWGRTTDLSDRHSRVRRHGHALPVRVAAVLWTTGGRSPTWRFEQPRCTLLPAIRSQYICLDRG